MSSSVSRLSIVIPVLNEAAHLATTLTGLNSAVSDPTTVEVIVVDGGSQDDTVAIAQSCITPSFKVQVLTSPRGRATQMNRGAAAARGDILLFLHGDTQLPPGFDQWIRQTLAQPQVVAGAFDLKIAGAGWKLRWVEWGVWWRSRLCQLPYGDQAIFLRAEVFQASGGFPELPIMEDFVLIHRLRRQGAIAIAPLAVQTSARRWQTLGVWQTTLLNQVMIVGYVLGVSPARLAHWYRRQASRIPPVPIARKP